MDFDLSRHPFFEEYVDPASGVASYILAERFAPIQKTLYYTQPARRPGSKWLWLTGTQQPATAKYVAAVSLDPDSPELRHFPYATVGNPLPTSEGDAVYVGVRDRIYLQPLEGEMREVLRLPAEVVGGRHVFRLFTDLTMSADGVHVALDSRIGNRDLVSIGNLETGKVTPLRWFARRHHHIQFSPVAPELILMGQGHWRDPISGDKFDMNIRMWLMDTAQTLYEPLFRDLWWNHNCKSCHEWWSPDGLVCWCDYDEGVYEATVDPRERRLVWPHDLLVHAHCDAQRRYWVADENPYTWREDKTCKVWFFDRETGVEIPILSYQPTPPLPPGDWRSYHVDPHPQITPDGELAVFTTTVRGHVDLGVAPLAPLKEMTPGA